MIFKKNSKILKSQWQIKRTTVKCYIKIIIFMLVNIKEFLKACKQTKFWSEKKEYKHFVEQNQINSIDRTLLWKYPSVSSINSKVTACMFVCMHMYINAYIHIFIYIYEHVHMGMYIFSKQTKFTKK